MYPFRNFSILSWQRTPPLVSSCTPISILVTSDYSPSRRRRTLMTPTTSLFLQHNCSLIGDAHIVTEFATAGELACVLDPSLASFTKFAQGDHPHKFQSIQNMTKCPIAVPPRLPRLPVDTTRLTARNHLIRTHAKLSSILSDGHRSKPRPTTHSITNLCFTIISFLRTTTITSTTLHQLVPHPYYFIFRRHNR